ncbi:hypothetical protein FRC08_000113 [Ceratobasidium sp. 394]|nr:hypothetical protein FRC08_000113 [Ceratobasidium sp. 394]
MYSRVAAAYSRAVFPRYALRGCPQLRGIPRTQGLLTARFPIFRDARYLSTPSANRTSAVLAHAPTQSDLEAIEEFSETEALPREEASLNITDAAAEVCKLREAIITLLTNRVHMIATTEHCDAGKRRGYCAARTG